MIIRGICATPDVPVEGMTLLGGAFDCNSDVPLLHRHDRPIGKVLTLSYRGDDLHILAETDDDVALKANYFSPGFRILSHQNGRVTRARLEEVSLTGDPVNPACRVLERQQHDPMVSFCRSQLEQRDLLKRRVELLQEYVRLIPSALAALAAAQPQPQSQPPPSRGSFSELATHLNSRLEA
jgi:hypothetical protein